MASRRAPGRCETRNWQPATADYENQPVIRTVLVPFVLVFAAAALLLRAADCAPAALGGEPRGLRRFETLQDVERATGVRVRLPAYFPDTLGWPPARIRLALGRPPVVCVQFAAASGGLSAAARVGPPGAGSGAAPRAPARLPNPPADARQQDGQLVVCETLGGRGRIPDRLTPRGLVLERSETSVGGRPGEIRRVSEEDGRLVHEVAWQSSDRTFRLSFSGPLQQLLLMADSIERGPK
jgi:hypothetical protein